MDSILLLYRSRIDAHIEHILHDPVRDHPDPVRVQPVQINHLLAKLPGDGDAASGNLPGIPLLPAYLVVFPPVPVNISVSSEFGGVVGEDRSPVPELVECLNHVPVMEMEHIKRLVIVLVKPLDQAV